ncbi:uncharacterized protein METZ01_LOCUS198242 [marine metagenome]|uniref:Uncharacterized protein n=1 Tax=marine metagenome TaxID=408172 RepID=A0A382E418_9ZZZZ
MFPNIALLHTKVALESKLQAQSILMPDDTVKKA